MQKKPKYRLQVLLVIKEKAKRLAEIELAKAIKKLKDEREKLEELEKELKVKQDKVTEEKGLMGIKVASGDAKMRDPQEYLNFIEVLKEDVVKAQEKIDDQKVIIQRAEKRVSRTRSSYVIAAQEMNVMEKHKELWTKKMLQELSASENKMLNELGNVVHQMNKFRT